MSRGIALVVSYDGAAFAGFGRQPGLRTVQGSIEAALATILRADIQVTGAGRTDAGVHALGQVVSFETPDIELDKQAFRRSINALCGPDIVARQVRSTVAGFSARFDAIAREYRYRIVCGPVPPLFLSRYAWWVQQTLDLAAMQDAAVQLIGEHDFRSFCVSGSAKDGGTVRAIELVDIVTETVIGEECVIVRVVGNAFLHSMVRVIVGSLVEIGAGRRDPKWIAEVLEARDRAAAGPTAPAHGLTLWRVEYPEECWL